MQYVRQILDRDTSNLVQGFLCGDQHYWKAQFKNAVKDIRLYGTFIEDFRLEFWVWKGIYKPQNIYFALYDRHQKLTAHVSKRFERMRCYEERGKLFETMNRYLKKELEPLP